MFKTLPGELPDLKMPGAPEAVDGILAQVDSGSNSATSLLTQQETQQEVADVPLTKDTAREQCRRRPQ